MAVVRGAQLVPLGGAPLTTRHLVEAPSFPSLRRII